MIVRIVAASLAWITLLGPVSAQTVTVRSGEHADFTRLVFNLPGRMDVGLTYRFDGIELAFEREGLTFNTNTVFEMVPPTRLSSLSVDEETLKLTLQCRCDVETFWASDRAFVVDIADETEISAALFPDPPAPVEAAALVPALPEPASVNPPAPASDASRMADQAPDLPDATALNLLSNGGTPNVGSVAFLIAEALDRQPSLASPPTPDLTDYATRVRESQAAVIEQIGRAATQGLLSPRDDLMPPNPVPIPDLAEEPAPLLTAPDAQAQALSTQTDTAQTATTDPITLEDNISISATT
ncbi:MAG: hypothetical protein AAFQ05_15520, partial [Pseudomonadota bacterium]